MFLKGLLIAKSCPKVVVESPFLCSYTTRRWHMREPQIHIAGGCSIVNKAASPTTITNQ